ncbi:MAP kinase kinase kinase mkh1 [Fusarium oxysporum f. sp. raphani]|uniref:non-specific serine/threonine protein kinase n=1 Tax=Fusarium oxysporum f. sp. raphani TaxID=96318 RepID=A0A8J5NP13_FUSOX|nr:MAP kinase kinase kinase mkh1 [Fusarium oxysporum f. sp. raphani]
MASSPSSSQATNEDFQGPLSSAYQSTITLRPQNAEAKLAFSQVVDWFLEKSQADDFQAQEREQASRCISIVSRQVCDQQVNRLVEQIETGCLSSSSPISSGRNVDKDRPSVYIHTGCYFIDLARPPANDFRGWVAGRKISKTDNDFILCLDNSSLFGIRQHHVAFQVHETGRILVQKISDRGTVEVNGDVLHSRESRLFNQHTSSIRLGQLTYLVEYTRHSTTQDHTKAMAEYIRKFYGHKIPLDISMTPTPAPGNAIQIGQWSLSSAGTIGVGGSGRVSVGVNKKGDVVAIKRMNVSETNGNLLRGRRSVIETLTLLATAAKEERIVRLVEVITDDPNATNKAADIWFVLTPFTPRTLHEYKGPLKTESVRSMTIALLEALTFLHANNWIHGDIKPMNIGIRKWDLDQTSIVLLDTEDAIYAPRGIATVTPGTKGTVGYISPERELGEFTATTDVWAVGVAAIWMLLGRHPWQYRVNPWREGEAFEGKRWLFHRHYDAAVKIIGECEDEAVLQMIRHPYARMEEQKKTRPGCWEVLQMFRAGSTGEGSGQKRTRIGAT